MWNILEDLKWGHMREKLVVSYLNENMFFDDRLKLYKNQKKQVDFRNEDIIGELIVIISILLHFSDIIKLSISRK